MRYVLAVLGAVAVACPGTAADEKSISAAIQKGGEYLSGRYANGVTGADASGYGLGATALVGLGMLEAGVKADDKAVKAVAEAVRTQSLTQTGTYHIALSILFLDRLGEKGDVPLIQTLGVRLYAGMNGTGGWSYNSWSNTNGAEAILKSLQTNELSTDPPKPGDDGKKDDFLKPTAAKGRLHPVAGKLMNDVQASIRASGRPGAGDDNSNTQFGIVGMWVAARHGVPAKDVFAALEARFIRTQNRDGGWSYTATGGETSTVAMTCAGLLGLAVGRGSRDAQPDKKESPKGDLPADDPFYTPKKGDGEKADTMKVPKANTGPSAAAADAGLKVLAGFLAAQQRPGGGNAQLTQFIGSGNSLYMLWSMERVGVGYGLETLGGVDWYQWGADHILALQAQNGSFTDGTYGPEINTAFALLFLCKSNFTKELGVKKRNDPGKGELRGGGAAPLQAPPPKQPSKQGGPAADPDRPGAGGFSLPAVAEPTEQGEAEKVGKGLVEAGEADWAKRLAEARDGKGAKWTRGLVLASGKLDGDKRHQAREALAERLVRMTARTLREMLRDPEIEVRRAACLACGMKDDRGHIPDLIARLTDPSDYVVRAARASLKSLSDGKDFGPTNAADDDSKIKAATAWAAWHDGQAEKK